jgi:hypothetical protein
MPETPELASKCGVCGKPRKYKTKQGLITGLNKPCVSCSNSIKLGGVGLKQIVDGKCICSKCNKNLPIEDFLIKKDDKHYSYCRTCHAAAAAKYYQETHKYSRYDITKEDYDQMLSLQDNKCCGCKRPLVKPYIDHCHSTNKVRGLLCQNCNSALGHVHDNTKTLENLIDYLTKEKK